MYAFFKIQVISVEDKYSCIGGCSVCIKDYLIDDSLDCCH